MKKSILIISAYVLFSTLSLFAQNSTNGAKIYGRAESISIQNERIPGNSVLSPHCPIPVYDVTPGKVLNCNSACATLRVRDSANLTPPGYMVPGWTWTINSIDAAACANARLEIWNNGAISASVGNNTIGTATANYLGTWAAWFGSCNTTSMYSIIQTYLTPTQNMELRMYEPVSNSVYTWTLRDNITHALVASGTFDFSTVTTAYLTTGVWGFANGIDQGTAVYTCPTCPPASWTDYQNGYAQFCPAQATPGKYGFTYTFTGGGCTKSYTDTITVNSIYDASWTSPGSICASSTYNLNNYLTGSATPGGVWSGTGVPGSGIGYSPTGSGTVSVTYTYGGGTACQVSQTHIITLLATPTVTITPPGPNSYCAGTPVNVTLTASGAITYLWNTAQTTSSIVVTPAISTTYTVVGTSGQGCSNTATFAVTFTPNPTISVSSQTNVNCKGQNTGGATITAGSGTPAYTYSWLPSGGTNPTASGLTAGTYTIIVTDSKGCSNTNTVTITEPAVALSASVSSQSPASCGQSIGSATIVATGGTPLYTYAWSPSGGTAPTASNLSAGNYVVTVTDSKSCMQTVSVTITNANGPNVNIASQNNPKCNGGTGSVTVTTTSGTTPYTYLWSNGNTTSAITGLAGTYTLTVTDASGCTATQIATITQPTAVNVLVNSINASCGQSDGKAMSNPSGGTSPYTYSWTGGQTTQNASGLSAGTYTITVTDANGCSKTASVPITNLNGPTATANTTTTIVSGASTTLTATGGATYLWAPSTGLSCVTCANPVASPTQTTIYCVIVKDTSGCSDSACVTITVSENDTCGDFFMPNVFSPNGDGKNDIFRPMPKSCFKDIDFSIYNRWGNLLFSTTDITKGWDGSNDKGKACNDGVYFYTLKATFIDGTLIDKKGTVTLLR